jgi:hypothetical protein
VALNYPDNTIWYVYSSTTDGKDQAEGSAVAIRLQKREQPQTAKSYLLTCGHVVRGTTERKRVIHAWPPDVGYNRDQSRRLNVDTEFKDLPNGKPSEAELRNAADDWVILKFEDGQAIAGIDVVRSWTGDNEVSEDFRIWGYAGGELSFSEGKVIPTKTADIFPFRNAAQGVINLTGDGARPGISGGGVFSVANSQFAGLHRGRLDEALQVSAVSSLHIRHRLYELGYEPVTLPGTVHVENFTIYNRAVEVDRSRVGPNRPDAGAESDLTTGIERLDADYAHRAAGRRTPLSVVAMPLHNDDFNALKVALLDAFSTARDFEPAVRKATGGKSLQQIANGDDLKVIVERVIRRAADEAWLSALLDAAVAERSNDVELARLREEWQAGARFGTVAGGSINHFKALLLPGKLVLIDRQPLRDALAGLDLGGVRVLIVDGDAESGKTYSLQYISYLSEALGTFTLAPVDLERVTRNANNKVDAAGLGEAIASALLGRSGLKRAADLNDTTWIEKYCDWLKHKLSDGATRWLVIDSFRKVTVEQNAYDLVAALAMRTYRDLPALRLVLLSYGERQWLSARVVGAVEYEWIAQIDASHLVMFFSELYFDYSKRRGETIEHAVLAPKVIASVQRVLGGAPASGARRLETLGRTTWAEVETILRTPAGRADPARALADKVEQLLRTSQPPPPSPGQ